LRRYSFAAIEAFAAGANLVAVALVVSALAAPGARVRALFRGPGSGLRSP